MEVEVTNDIKVRVKAEYEPQHSSPQQFVYVFSYHVVIENQSDTTYQIKERCWRVFDSLKGYKEITGEGVVGETPILESGNIFEYISGCKLNSSIGSMSGTYLVERLRDGKSFEVEIPEFNLLTPFRLN